MNKLAYYTGYMEKLAKTLTPSSRTHIKQKNFGIPSKAEGKEEKKKSGNYPIHDRAHARSALSYGSRYLSSEKFKALKARIHAKYPTMGKEAGWKQHLGSLSSKSLKKLKKAGLIQSDYHILKGMAKGTKNIVKKTGYTDVSKTGKRPWWNILANGGAGTDSAPDVRQIFTETDNLFNILGGKRKAILKAIAKRHEAYEAAAFPKAYIRGYTHGPHFSKGVLTKELKDVNNLPYPGVRRRMKTIRFLIDNPINYLASLGTTKPLFSGTKKSRKLLLNKELKEFPIK